MTGTDIMVIFTTILLIFTIYFYFKITKKVEHK